MRERNEESSLWQRRLKQNALAKTTVLPYAANDDVILDKNQRYRKPQPSRNLAMYCLYFQLALAVLLLVVPPQWYKYAFFRAQSSIETPIASTSTSSLSTPSPEESSSLSKPSPEESSSLSKPSSPQDEETKRRAQAMASMSKKLEGRCKTDASWKKDSFWRNSVEDPAVCLIGVPKPDESLNLGVSHLIETLGTLTSCGSYCVFHLESSPLHASAGSAAGQQFKGWSLGALETANATKGCFRPIADIKSSHCNEWYDQWAIWVNSTLAAQS